MSPLMGGIVFSVCAAATLSACVSGPPSVEPYQLDAALQQAFAGQHMSRMYARYGSPASQKPYGQMTILTWQRTEWLDFGTGPQPFQCQMDAYIRQDGTTVDGVTINGKMGACEHYLP